MIGETVGNFRLISRLGRGGMGEVYLAEQQSIGTRVAVKLLQAGISEDKDHVQRFFNEARAVSRIQHAGIVKIFDVGFHPQTGQAYLIMEYLEGESLGRRIRRSALTVAQVADFGRQIASVLEATHAAGITHRDLKPDNIYLVPDRELGERIKVLDFGIAKLTNTLGGGFTQPRTVGTLGTPAYMAPEQWGDSSKVDWRCDLYALGCVTFEMLCGRPPFEARTYAEACAQHLTMAPPAAASIVPDTPAALEDLLARLLAKDPADRPQSLHDVVAAFDAIARHPSASITGQRPPRVSGDAATVAAGADGTRPTTGATADTAVQPAPSPIPAKRRPVWVIPVALVGLGGVALGARYFLAASKPDKRADVVVVADVPVDAMSIDAPVDATVLDAPAPADAGASQQTLDHAVEVLVKNRDRLAACYAKHGVAKGRVEITVDVDPTGAVEAVSLTGADPKVERCLRDATKTLAFGKSPSSFSKTYVLELVAPRPRPVATAGDAPTGPLETSVSPEAPPDADAIAKLKREYVTDATRRVRARGLDECRHADDLRALMLVEVKANGRVERLEVKGVVPATVQCVKAVMRSIKLAPVPPSLKPPLMVPMQYLFGPPKKPLVRD